jgi:hypothetical protein
MGPLINSIDSHSVLFDKDLPCGIAPNLSNNMCLSMWLLMSYNIIHFCQLKSMTPQSARQALFWGGVINMLPCLRFVLLTTLTQQLLVST